MVHEISNMEVVQLLDNRKAVRRVKALVVRVQQMDKASVDSFLD